MHLRETLDASVDCALLVHPARLQALVLPCVGHVAHADGPEIDAAVARHAGGRLGDLGVLDLGDAALDRQLLAEACQPCEASGDRCCRGSRCRRNRRGGRSWRWLRPRRQVAADRVAQALLRGGGQRAVARHDRGVW